MHGEKLKILKYMITADLKQYYQNMFGQRQNLQAMSLLRKTPTAFKTERFNFRYTKNENLKINR